MPEDDKFELKCAVCANKGCDSMFAFQKAKPANCPLVTDPGTVEKAGAEYDKQEICEFARQASIVEFENYEFAGGVRSRGTLRAVTPRVEETVRFARKIGAKRLGVAFCSGLRGEAKVLNDILEGKGFEVISVACKVGAVPKEKIGLKKEEKIFGPDFPESMCNPITQAELLNSRNVNLAILLGLCVGHDSLFIKYCKAPVTVLVVKDRVFGHNPVMGLYLAPSLYYGRLLAKDANG